MAPSLPDDVLHLFCEHLAELEHFDTLFNCACASRAFAIPALTHLYRAHHKCPVRGGGEDEGYPPATKLLMVQKWSILWKSIVASSLDATLFPYCHYIKVLDFRDLGNLLDDDQFKIRLAGQFFSGPMVQFHKKDTVTRRNGSSYDRLNITEIVNAIGEVVTKDTPMLELISGPLTSSALIRWVPRLSRLRGLELWDGSALEDILLLKMIHDFCPAFDSLMINAWPGQDRDHSFAQFIIAMEGHTLKTIHTIRDVGAAAETFIALSAHSASLQELRICVSSESTQYLHLLSDCTALEILQITDENGLVSLEDTEDDAFLATIDWLKKCKKLQRLSFSNFSSAASLVTPLLLEHDIRLHSLEIDGYVLKDHRHFHQALMHQKDSLNTLSLSGDTDEMFRDDLDIIVDSLKQLTQLKVLKLLLPEVFHEEHIVVIVNKLHLLAELYVSGLELNDRLLETIGNLHNLRSVTLAGISKFTVDGLLEFVCRLGPGNAGIRVMVDMASSETLLTAEEVALVKSSLDANVGGTLEYTPWRDPKDYEFETDSD